MLGASLSASVLRMLTLKSLPLYLEVKTMVLQQILVLTSLLPACLTSTENL